MTLQEYADSLDLLIGDALQEAYRCGYPVSHVGTGYESGRDLLTLDHARELLYAGWADSLIVEVT